MNADLDEFLLGPESSRSDIAAAIRGAAEGDNFDLTRQAYKVKTAEVGRVVYFRGIVELSNRCPRNCLYCGIRRGNRFVKRYTMTPAEIIDAARFAWESGYGSIVLQAGESRGPAFIKMIDDVLHEIRRGPMAGLGVTLSLGDQSRDTLKRWFESGATRYLLRIETSNPELFARIHPAGQKFEDRLACLDALRGIGYQVGTGVMMALPGQTYDDLAGDIDFFRKIDADMIGMGPWLPHDQTPLGKMAEPPGETDRARLLKLGLTMIAATRLVLRDVNIAATTALQTLSPVGRELGILAGANVIMPNLTPVVYRASYQLYNDKPCIEENATRCRNCLEGRIRSTGETTGTFQKGDPPHFARRTAGRGPGRTAPVDNQ